MNLPEDKENHLRRAMAAWRVAPVRDPQFRARVWARIEAARGSTSWPLYVRAHRTSVAGMLAVALVAGALLGREQARSRTELESGRMAAAYVRALDARTMVMP